ncbi:hypothetical protein [Thermomonas sp.]|uniref:hypothetical protein n=1 Tax=Thermomonas sp. TaxID=1971895 RepID=UPI0024892659|nr:hypothetical protein [Thermomonas sp.]MDI1252067.1 hypothetical protein [Thermomonas sp.]
MHPEDIRKTGMEPPVAGFGERFASSMAIAFSGMALMLCVGSLVRPSPWSFYAVAFSLVLSYWFRRRLASDEQRHNEVMEDERDAAILARSERVFRRFASCWFVALALILSMDATRSVIPAHAYALPSLVLLGVVGANIAGHFAAAMAYRRDRLAQ